MPHQHHAFLDAGGACRRLARLAKYRDTMAPLSSANCGEGCSWEADQLTHQLKARGPYLAVNPLQPTPTATGVGVRDGKPLVTAGLLAETCEPLGGTSWIAANDLADTIRIAARIPGARVGTVEIRPVMEIAGRPMRVRNGRMP